MLPRGEEDFAVPVYPACKIRLFGVPRLTIPGELASMLAWPIACIMLSETEGPM